MTQKKQATPIWPFMIVLVFLFTMSVTAPRGWERFAQRSELAKPSGTYVNGNKPARMPESVGLHNSFVGREPTMPQPATGMRAETRPRITSEYTPAAQPTQPNLKTSAQAAPAQAFRLNGGTPRGEAIAATVPTPAAIDLTASFSTPKATPTATATPTLNASQPIASQANGPQLSGPQLGPAPRFTSGTGASTPVAQPNIAPAPQITAPKLAAPQVAPPQLVAALPTVIKQPTLAPPAATVATPVVATPKVQRPPLFVETSLLPKITPSFAPSKSVAPIIVVPVASKPEAPAQVAPVLPKQEPAPAGFSLNGRHTPQPTVATPAPVMVAARPDAGTLKTPVPETTVKPTPAGVDPRYAPLPKPRETVVAAPVQAPAEKSFWPKLADLEARLDRLQQRRETQSWAERTSKLLTHLRQHNDGSPTGIQDSVALLRAAVADTHLVDERDLDPQTAVEVRLTRHALLRRLDVWESLGNLMRKARIPTDVAAADTKQLELCLVELDRQTAAAGETGKQWRDYLMLESLGEVAEGKVLDGTRRRTLAKTVLDRIHKAGANSEQNAFLNEGPFAQLNAELRGLAAEEVDGRKLLESIEAFEAGGLPADAHALAAQCRLLDDSTDEDRRQLATWLTSHYRNANVRVTLSADLLNRMMPSELKKSGPVNELVLGLPTQGWSTTRTGVGIRFLPSQDRLAMRMEAEGVVHAQTQTHSGPVHVFNQSDSAFVAYKDLALTPDGVVVHRAVASTNSRNRLRGIKTDFDHMPILGSIVESIAIDQHAEKQQLARQESQTRVSRGVERGLDQEIDKHLKTADAELQSRIITPLAGLDLAPEVIEMQSNEARAIMRVRIAGDDQLAAYTPRPRAYSDNVGSVQVHQSAVNNVLEKSALHGRRFTLPELYRFVVEKYYLPDTADLSEIPTDIELTFAKVDPLTVRCEAGTVELRLALEELSRAGKSWRDFVVRVKFKTEVVQGRTCFVRDGFVKLNGPKLSATSQIPLRTVFAKVFPDDMRVVLWPDKYRNDPRFADLDIEQVDIRDGWIGMAIGPRRLQASALLPPKR